MQNRIYTAEELPIEKYHAAPGFSNSGIQHIKRSPLHYWTHCLDPERAPKKETPAKLEGRAFHTLIEDANLFAKQFCIEPARADYPDHPDTIDELIAFAGRKGISLPKGTKPKMLAALREALPGFSSWDEAYEAIINNRKVLSSEQWERIHRMRDSVMAHPSARVLLEKGVAEKSFFYEHGEFGAQCKTRPDWMFENIVIDFKTTLDASKASFDKDIYANGYHTQCALGVDGLAAHGIKCDAWLNLAIEKEAPFAVSLYELTQNYLPIGRDDAYPAIALYAKCMKENKWPSYPPTIQAAEAPAWVQRKAL